MYLLACLLEVGFPPLCGKAYFVRCHDILNYEFCFKGKTFPEKGQTVVVHYTGIFYVFLSLLYHKLNMFVKRTYYLISFNGNLKKILHYILVLVIVNNFN